MKKVQLYIFIWTFLLGVFTPILPTYADCNNSCSAIDNSSCKGTQALQGNSSSKMDVECLINNSKDSCFNQVPVESTTGKGKYNSIGMRADKSKKSGYRYHYGSDIQVAGDALSVADDGIVAFYNETAGGGPALVINYKKKCKGASGEGEASGWYHAVYRHLCQKYVSVGDSVSKNTKVGKIGGGNTVNGKVCHNTLQKKDCPTSCTSGFYGIHLHLEIEDGKFGGSSTKANDNKIIAPYCKDVSVLCGGCSSAQECKCKSECSGSFAGTAGTGTGSAEAQHEEGEVDVEDAKSCQLAQFLDSSNCVFCDMFKIIFNTASELALTAINNLAIPSRNLVITGFLIWMFFYLLKQISSFSATSTGEMLKGLIYQGFRVAVVVLILNGAIFQVMNLTLNPVMLTGFNFANSLNSGSTCDNSATYMQNIKGYEGNYTDGNVTGGLPIDIGKSIVCSIKKLEDGTGVLMGLGNYSLCLGHNKHRFLFGVLPGPAYIFTGWLLWIVGAVLLIMFPWCLIDCVLQLCIAAALIPCAIAAFAFKITQKYIKIIWNFFMNAMFNFVFMAIIVYIINSHLVSWLGLPDGILDGRVILPDEFFAKSGMVSNVADGLKPVNYKTLFHIEGIVWWGSAAMKIIAICFLCWSFFDEAAAMAKRFADSPGLGGKKGIGPMVGGDLAQGAKKYVGAPAMHFAGRGASALGHKVNAVAGNQFRSGMNRLKGQGMNLLGRMGIADSQVTKRDDATGKPLEYKSKIRIFGRDIERTVSKGENGWISDKTSHKRTEIDKAFEVVKDKDGNIVRDASGNPKYLSRQRTLGMVNGYEEMTSSVDANGNIHYQTADGSRSFTMNKDGEIISYKTPFTSPVLGLFGTPREKTDRHSYGTTHTVNDGLSKTVKKLDANGKVISSSTKYMNSSSTRLIEKDGTINATAFNQIKNGSDSAETAATYMVGQVMKSRGMELSDNYISRDVRINDDGSFTITQKHEIGKDKKNQTIYERQIISAKIIGNQMVLDITSQNSEGDITHHLSNGMQTKVSRFEIKYNDAGQKMTDRDGKLIYTRDEKLFFSDYLNRRNSGHGVLDTMGRWGNLADRDKIMTGFTHEDYDKHLSQLMLKELQRTMTKDEFNKLLKTAGSQINILNGKLRTDMSQTEIMALNAAAASLLGIQLPDPTQGPTPIPNPDPSTPIQEQDPTTPQPNPEQTNPDTRSPNEEERAKTEEEQRKEAEERAKEAEERVKKAEEEKRQKEAEEKAKADEEKRQKEAEEKAKADEEKRQKEAEEKAKAEEEKRQKEAEEKNKAEGIAVAERRMAQEKEELDRLQKLLDEAKQKDEQYLKELAEKNKADLGITEGNRQETQARMNIAEEREQHIRKMLQQLEETEARQRQVLQAKGVENWKDDPTSVQLQEYRDKLEQELKQNLEEQERMRQRQAIEQEDQQLDKEATQKLNQDKHERLHDEYNQLETERAQLEKEREEITQRFAEVNAQLSTAKDAIDAVGITDAEKRERQALYNELLRQSNQLKEQLGKLRKDRNDRTRDYNSRTEKHNDEIPNKRLK